METKKLLAYRKFAGIGDWLMALSVLKMVNMQYPNIDIYLNGIARNCHKHRYEWRILPNLVQEIIHWCDVEIKQEVIYSTFNRHNDYDFITGHMVYDKKSGKQFIESMVDKFNARTGLSLKYDPAIFARCDEQMEIGDPIINEPYLLIQSCSKRKHLMPSWKDYGFSNMKSLVNILKKRVKIVQIGAEDDLRLPVNHIFLGKDLKTLHNLMINSFAFIGLDGMLGVYAAHHSIRHFIIYSGKFNMNWTKFPFRVQIDGNKTNNADIAKIIMDNV